MSLNKYSIYRKRLQEDMKNPLIFSELFLKVCPYVIFLPKTAVGSSNDNLTANHSLKYFSYQMLIISVIFY